MIGTLYCPIWDPPSPPFSGECVAFLLNVSCDRVALPCLLLNYYLLYDDDDDDDDDHDHDDDHDDGDDDDDDDERIYI